MLTPPFKRSAGGLAALVTGDGASPRVARADACCEPGAKAEPASATAARSKLHQLDAHLHCSVIGNCLGTAELRRLMARHVDVQGADDVEVHHLAVSRAAQGGEVSKALHKALDQRHAGALRSFAEAQDATALEAAWKRAWSQGEIPGAYWALLTHKAITPALRHAAFGEVHMLSHLMGSANRHELKRFVALEQENAQLHERLEREQQRRHETLQERDQLATWLQQQSLEFERRLAEAQASQRAPEAADASELVALQAQRRERAERQVEEAQALTLRLEAELERLQTHGAALVEELAAAEAELQHLSRAPEPGVARLQSRRVLYVGGRPSSTPAIRDYVLRHGGEFLHHDGGLESRKGLLAALLPRADVVVFPVDCVDHDSVQNLKRLSERHQVPFVALRSASLASFAAALPRDTAPAGDAAAPRFCLRHG